MSLVSALRYALILLVPGSFIATVYLYYYPVFEHCAFPTPGADPSVSYLNTLRQHLSPSVYNVSSIAPFRLLALGDPQLEGDTSINSDALAFPNLAKFWEDILLLNGKQHSLLERIRYSLHDLVDFYFDDIPRTLDSYRKRVDLVGNDYYLAHIYRSLHWWAKPSHVSILGDLVGSQWIDDVEFDSRGNRFWNRVFRHGQRVSDEVTALREHWDYIPYLDDDAGIWSRRIINVAGNHDIGYAGDLTVERFERFERVFGRANYELRFYLPPSLYVNASTSEREIPELRIVVLNDMNLDTPASSRDLQDATYKFLNDVITSSHPVTRPAIFTLLLTHIPLHKERGICADAPFFSFHDTDEFAYGVKEQNHLSPPASAGVLEGIFGLSGNGLVDGAGYGRRGLVLTGHDHEGCDVYHYINQSASEETRHWEAMRTADAANVGVVNQLGVPGLREITLRSMMGEFGGNAGLLSLWFDTETWEWKYDFATCTLGLQHWWWSVHIVDVITICVIIVYASLKLFGPFVASRAPKKGRGAGAIKINPTYRRYLNYWLVSGRDKWRFWKLKWIYEAGYTGLENSAQIQSSKQALQRKKGKRAFNGSPRLSKPESVAALGLGRPSASLSIFERPSLGHER